MRHLSAVTVYKPKICLTPYEDFPIFRYVKRRSGTNLLAYSMLSIRTSRSTWGGGAYIRRITSIQYHCQE